jgi:hypothetical protein
VPVPEIDRNGETVYRAGDGTLAIRKGDWVLIDGPTGDVKGSEPEWFREEREMGCSSSWPLVRSVVLAAVLANLSLAGLAGQISVVVGAYAIIGWGPLLSVVLPIYARTGDALPDGDGQKSAFPVRRGRFAFRAGLEVLVAGPVATL